MTTNPDAGRSLAAAYLLLSRIPLADLSTMNRVERYRVRELASRVVEAAENVRRECTDDL